MKWPGHNPANGVRGARVKQPLKGTHGVSAVGETMSADAAQTAAVAQPAAQPAAAAQPAEQLQSVEQHPQCLQTHSDNCASGPPFPAASATPTPLQQQRALASHQPRQRVPSAGSATRNHHALLQQLPRHTKH